MSKIKIAILTPNHGSDLETFVKNHIDYLPFEKMVIYGKPLPHKVSESDGISVLVRFIYIIHKVFKTKKSQDPLLLYKMILKNLLKTNNVQLVFAEYVLTGSRVCDVCKELNIPIMASGLGYEISIKKVIEDNRVAYGRFLKYCSFVVVVAKSMSKILLELGSNESKIIHSPAGASEDFLGIQPEFKNAQLFAIGRFVEKKSPHSTILAFYNVLKKFPDAKLVFAGDGPLLPVCEDIVKALNIESQVFFVGKISQEEQRNYLKNSSVFVQHSKIASDGDSEGTPVAIVEASSAGLPVVSTFHAGIIDVIIDKETGFLVEEGNINEMSAKIIELLENRELAKSMGMAGKKNIQTNFTLTNHINTIEKYILTAISQKEK